MFRSQNTTPIRRNDHPEVLRSDRITLGLSDIGTISADLDRESQRLTTKRAPIINAFAEPRKPGDIFGMDTSLDAISVSRVTTSARAMFVLRDSERR
jgi:hypothetical protein